MPILVVIILFACAIGIVLALITLSLQRISGRVVEQYKQKLDDANTIINQNAPPDSWVQPFRARIGERPDGVPYAPGEAIFYFVKGRDRSAEEIGEQARKHCLKRLRMLTSFMEKGNFYDDDRTKEMVVNSLKSEYDKWASCHWTDLVLTHDTDRSD
ncbi:MAG: hypothetical protein F4X14_01355 [Caldilineaceae bacterium SB0661_bin_32]|uniref:Uncharacterized protein n=1 Tax=Caldilineaceae bacterium SB0661_bin_32 TaxID=2605255 RepID=A0A6B1D2A0_9CHLR|nr:hypothetical protein [Caldilineaceae bacterium SB0661_bin_32]